VHGSPAVGFRGGCSFFIGLASFGCCSQRGANGDDPCVLELERSW
jgi:hypothetical protein